MQMIFSNQRDYVMIDLFHIYLIYSTCKYTLSQLVYLERFIVGALY